MKTRLSRWVGVLLVSVVSLSHACRPAPSDDNTTKASAVGPWGSIDEKMFVPIGGIEQWISIRGTAKENPVVLNLHGGPGATTSPFADAMFGDWYQDFTVVQWDQRGAGRTYGKTGAAIKPTMTVERMVKDGVEVAEYLRQHLGKRKVILTGGSWGSFLGAQMAKARPDLFHAYVGIAQMVSPDDWAQGYARTLDLARQANDRTTVADLEAIGPPPWDHLRKFGTWSRSTRVFEAKAGAAPLEPRPSKNYTSETQQWQEAAEFSQIHFFGLDMSGELATLNLPALGTNFELPVFFVQGEADLKSVPAVTRAYFDQIQAPTKELFLVPNAGHEPSAVLMDQWRKVLIEQVRPLALER